MGLSQTIFLNLHAGYEILLRFSETGYIFYNFYINKTLSPDVSSTRFTLKDSVEIFLRPKKKSACVRTDDKLVERT